jgi:hypothetical protein
MKCDGALLLTIVLALEASVRCDRELSNGEPQRATQAWGPKVEDVEPQQKASRYTDPPTEGLLIDPYHSIAHRLGRHGGVEGLTQSLTSMSENAWESNFFFDYSLMTYRNALAKFTKSCIDMMKKERISLSEESNAVIEREVGRVWPMIEIQGVMKKQADEDIHNGDTPAWLGEESRNLSGRLFVQKVPQSYPFIPFYPKAPFYRNYLESAYGDGDHEVLGDKKHQYRDVNGVDASGGRNAHNTMYNGAVRPVDSAFHNDRKVHEELGRHDQKYREQQRKQNVPVDDRRPGVGLLS